MNHVFHRHTAINLSTAVRGEGAYIIDDQGKHYLDASSGAAVSCLGHNNPYVIEAIKSQLDRIPYAHSSFFTNEPMEKLADMLCERAPGDLDRVYFMSGGSEAIEASLKMARQYFLEIGEPGRHRFISRRQSYHGNTLGALSVGGNQWRRAQFRPLLMEAHHISPCYPYRDKSDDETLEQYGLRVANELEEKLTELGPETVIAFIAEPVVGATAGALVPAPGYFKRLREICDRYGVLLILDEVMCGMGRTGTLFACEQDDVCGDLVTIAKGLAAGYQPIGALLASRKIYEAIKEGSGFFQHGHTFMGHPAACAAAVATLQVIERDKLLDNVTQRGNELKGALKTQFKSHPHIGDIRGRGLFLGIELVRDRDSRETFDPALPLHTRIKAEALNNGLMCYPMSGTIDGKRGHHILLAPPFIIDSSQVDEIVSKLSTSIDSVLKSVQ
ncbi:MAG: adenosylmethionine-8-amino-7-oxononanoate aminotransferase [marine bacterium B5-7]|nr:MAG: adenosylmethionine-8-amino-7-oxononanoate aminotransferase [marine bacterium B5-7]